MKQAKRILCLCLALVMALCAFAGCGKKETNKKKPGDRTLVVGIPQDSTIPDYDTNAFCVYLEEATGIDVEWMYFSGSQYTQQLTLMCTSGGDELPDVLLGFTGMSHYTVNQFGEDGYIIDLKDLIEKKAPNFKKAVAGLDEDFQNYIWEKGTNTTNGSYYALPLATTTYVDNLQTMTWINKDWLAKVNKPMPTTIDELTDVLKAWRAYGDLNGNGVEDEVLVLADAGVRAHIMNAFVEYRAGNWNVKDGKLWDPIVSDEYRQALSYIADLGKQGLIDKLSWSINGKAEFQQLISPTDGPTKVGIWSGHYSVRVNQAGDHLKDFQAFAPLKDYTGKGGFTTYTDTQLLWSAMITENCEDPELAMEFLDCFYLDETVARQRHGEKDVDWVYDEGENLHGTTSFVKVLNPQAYFDGSLNKCTINWLGILTWYNYLTNVEDAGEKTVAGKEGDRLYREQWAILQKAMEEDQEVLGDLVYTMEEYDVREEKAGTLNDYLADCRVKFQSGEMDVNNDAEWNKYKDTVKKLGREELQKIAEAAYARKTK